MAEVIWQVSFLAAPPDVWLAGPVAPLEQLICTWLIGIEDN